MLIFVRENWFINLISVLNGKQTPSEQEENRTSPQDERRPKLLFLLLLKNKATLCGERKCPVIAPKAHLRAECVCTEGRRVRAGKRAPSQSWYPVTRQVRLHLALRHPCYCEGNGTRARYQPNRVIQQKGRWTLCQGDDASVAITYLSETAIFFFMGVKPIFENKG